MFLNVAYQFNKTKTSVRIFYSVHCQRSVNVTSFVESVFQLLGIMFRFALRYIFGIGKSPLFVPIRFLNFFASVTASEKTNRYYWILLRVTGKLLDFFGFGTVAASANDFRRCRFRYLNNKKKTLNRSYNKIDTYLIAFQRRSWNF